MQDSSIFSQLVGKTITRIDTIEEYWDNVAKRYNRKKVPLDILASPLELEFETSDGKTFLMYHEQDCCESVFLSDIAGDIDDILNTPIIRAEVVESTDEQIRPNESECCGGSETWTFYKIDTAKGGVTLRWFGSSNGWYSEEVTFRELTD